MQLLDIENQDSSTLTMWWRVLQLSILIYYVITISFRLCFYQPYDLYNDSPGAIFFDYFFDLIMIIDWIADSLKSSKISPITISSSQRSAKHNTQPVTIWNQIFSSVTISRMIRFLALVPFELLAYASGNERYYALRCFRLVYLVYFVPIWNEICKWLRDHDKLNSDAVQRVFFLILVMALVAHVGACLFYRIGLEVVKSGSDRNWLVKDKLVQMTSAGYAFLKPVSFRYLRSMYWSVQTLDTVGFGDVVALSESETWYCIFFFYISAILIYYSIANLMTVLTNVDSSRTNNLIQKSKFNHYALYRKLPVALVNRVHSYYDYQWKMLHGVDELNLLSELSPNFTQQVKQHLLRDKLQRLDVFKELGKGVLSVLSDTMESYVFSPDDTIVEHESRVSGAYIIGNGQVEIFNVQNESLEIRKEGHVFGLGALHKSYTSLHLYKSKSFSEIFFLRGSIYRYICERYLTPYEWKDLQARNQTMAASSGSMSNLKKRGTMLVRNTRIAPANAQNTTDNQIGNKFSFPRNSYLAPQSIFRNIWDSIVFCCLLFYLTTTALLLATSLHQDFVSNVMPLLIASYIIDGVAFCDFILSAFFFQYNEDGVIITSPRKIWNEYRKNNTLILVALSLFPFDVIFGWSINPRIIPLLRLLKLLHLSNFQVYFEIFLTFFSFWTGLSITFEMQRFLTLYVLLFQLCHWVGCIWQLAADMSTDLFHYPINWIQKDRANTSVRPDYDAMAGVVYTRSIYWAASVMSSIGFPDIVVTNPVEIVTIILVMFFGYLMFNTLLGAIANLIGSFNREKREFSSKVEKMRQVMKHAEVNAYTEAKVIRYFEYIWARYGGMNERDILSTLPKSMRETIVYHVVESLVTGIPFFQGCSEPLERAIMGLFESRVFLDGDMLMVEGEMGKEMFVIERGEVVVCSKDKSVKYATLRRGSYVGESSLLEVAPRTASVYAVGYVDTYLLTAENFFKAAERFPDEFSGIVEGIRLALAEKAKKNKQKFEIEKADITKTEESTISDAAATNNGRRETQRQSQRLSVLMPAEFSLRDQSGCLLLHPDSFLKLLWDVLIFCTMLYYCIVTPLRISVVLSNDSYWIDYMMDFIGIVDCVLCAYTFAIYHEGHLVVRRKEIWAQYMTNRLPLDVVTYFPYDVFAAAVPNSSPHVQIVRAVLRLPKILKMSSVSHYYKQIERLILYLKINHLLFRLIELTFIIIMFGIWVGSGWLLFAEMKNFQTCDGGDHECLYRGTWIEQQILSNKLPDDGGGKWARFIRAMNWAIPTITSETMGDIYAMNEKESLFAFVVMFCGLAVNGAVIGNIFNLVSDANVESIYLLRKIDRLRHYLLRHDIPANNILSCSRYLQYMTTREGILTASRDSVFSQLPYALKSEIDKQLKILPYLRRCPFFDFCSDELLIGISAKLKLQIFIKEDKIVNFGDLGHEMFFIESGKVEIVSGDGSVVYSTLEDGAFFGETALFFRSTRVASVRVISPFCICLVLSKHDLDEELRSLEYDFDEVLQAFRKLQDSNASRNNAVKKNLEIAHLPNTKLHKMIDTGTSSNAKKTLLLQLREIMYPESIFRAIWDCIGMILLLYYIFSIPLFIAFFFGEKNNIYRDNVGLELVIQAYWIADIFFKCFCFSFRLDVISCKLVTDGDLIWQRYVYSNYFWYDVVSSIPVEIAILFPGMNYLFVYLFRATHLFRVFQLYEYMELFEQHVKHFTGAAIRQSLSYLIRAGLAYLILNHWLACVYFMIHRYGELTYPMTYVIADGFADYDVDTGRHNICNTRVVFCYARSIYFVLGTMTSIGYGDISPFTNKEIVYEQAIAIGGAFIAAVFLGFCGNYQLDLDCSSEEIFKAKIKSVEMYMEYRNLPDTLRRSIVNQYSYIWKKQHSINGERKFILHEVSSATAFEVALLIHRDVISTTYLLADTNNAFQRRLAAVMYPQLIVRDGHVYNAGDVAKSIFFVKKGLVDVQLTTDKANLDAVGYMALKILLKKEVVNGSSEYGKGFHFGEFGALSRNGLRCEDVIAKDTTELLYVTFMDLWKVFIYTASELRDEFLWNMMITIGKNRIWDDPHPALDSLRANTDNLFSFYKVSSSLASFITDKLDSSGDDLNVKETDRMLQIKQLLRNSTVIVDHSEDEKSSPFRMMRHSFSLEGILNRKRGNSTAIIEQDSEDDDEDDDDDDNDVKSMQENNEVQDTSRVAAEEVRDALLVQDVEELE